ncbi:unnamed protein product [Parnassius apollo]|uniref:(apollo) hypothetical protein n=1 Tax=Parnassius apollo TaxID=110799 RepID=A0A8S3WH70_PARAO|nr:unnamed protein product [Parnassius apollo]
MDIKGVMLLIITLISEVVCFINTKRNDISLEQQQIPRVPNVKNNNQEIRNNPSAINTGNQNERNINPNQNHLFQTGSGYLAHENKLNALQILNNQPKESRPGNNTTKKKLSTRKSDHNKRYKVIHNNGTVEYYDDFYVILEKYPNIKIANNILYSQITQNMKFNKLPSNILKDHADIFLQYKNEQAYQKPPKPVEEKALLKTIVNKTPEKPFVPQLSSLKLKQNTQAQPSMLENDKKNIVTTNALAKGSENTYISSFKTEHIATPKVGNEVQLLVHRLDDAVEQPVTHALSNNHHPEVSLLQSAPNVLFESSKSKNTTGIKNYSKQNSNITKPITISSVLNDNKNKNMTSAVQLDTKTNVEKSPLVNITSGLSKNQTEYNTNLYKENIFDPIRTVNLTTPECFDENFSIKQNVTESKSEHPDNTENVNSTEDSINNKDDQDKDYLSLSKPQMWLRTTDPDFWKKLIDDNDAYSFVYIFDIQSQSKVEKDTKTTIYPNGTVMEEITETIWENGDGDQPKVFKTVKVTYPDDEKKGQEYVIFLYNMFM